MILNCSQIVLIWVWVISWIIWMHPRLLKIFQCRHRERNKRLVENFYLWARYSDRTLTGIFLSSFLERQYWGLPCFLGWLNLKFDISKKQKMMHRSFQTFNLQLILHLKITSIHLLFISMKILSLKQQSTTLLFSSSWDYSRLWLYPYEIGFMEIQVCFQAASAFGGSTI